MRNKVVTLSENKLRNLIKSVIRESFNNNGLDPNEVMTLAKIVVKKYGNGNCIDLNNTEELVQTVAQVMRMNNCEYEALVYMSGAKGGGW